MSVIDLNIRYRTPGDLYYDNTCSAYEYVYQKVKIKFAIEKWNWNKRKKNMDDRIDCPICDYRDCCFTHHPELHDVVYTKSGLVRKQITKEMIKKYPNVFTVLDEEH